MEIRTFSFQKISLLVLVLLLLINSCGVSARPSLTPTYQDITNTPAKTSTLTITPTLIKKITKTLTPSSTSTETLTPTPINMMNMNTDIPLTPLPTEQVKTWIRGMMENNGGCRLPCWWGITPGKTTWSEAEEILSPYATRISIIDLSDRQYTGADFLWPPIEVTSSFLSLNFTVRENIIQSISLLGIGQASAYRLPELMSAYGEPGGVFVNAYSGWAYDSSNPRPISLHVYYPAIGILAQYVAPDSSVDNGTIHGCIQYGTLVKLWTPTEMKTYTEMLQTTSLNFQFPFLSVSKALGMDTHQFYETFKGENKEVCLTTPADIWVWGVTPTPTP